MEALGRSSAKEEARDVIARLPDGATWEDLMYELCARQKIAEGMNAADEGRVVSQEEVKRRFLSVGPSPKPWERR